MRLVQQPGEIVVTLPRAYHAGFSCGFNCGEAVNFAAPEWLPFAQQCGARLRRLGQEHILPVEQLVVAEAEDLIARARLGPGAEADANGKDMDGGGRAASDDGGRGRDQQRRQVAADSGPAEEKNLYWSPAPGGIAQEQPIGLQHQQEQQPIDQSPSTPVPQGGAPPPPDSLVSLHCFVRLMRWSNGARHALLARGMGWEWLDELPPGGDASLRSLPCVGCREPAFLAVVMRRESGECFCLRCAEGDAGLSGAGAVLLLRRSLPRLEAQAQ